MTSPSSADCVPTRWRKKPVEIEARQLLDDLGNHIAIVQWIKDSGQDAYMSPLGSHITICTLEGDMRADLGDWIIKGVQGEFYPCKPDIFEATYESVTTPAACEHDPRYSRSECAACGQQVAWCGTCSASLCGCPAPHGQDGAS